MSGFLSHTMLTSLELWVERCIMDKPFIRYSAIQMPVIVAVMPWLDNTWPNNKPHKCTLWGSYCISWSMLETQASAADAPLAFCAKPA